jgi:hypothetical protein
MDLQNFIDNLDVDSPAYHFILWLGSMLIILSYAL